MAFFLTWLAAASAISFPPAATAQAFCHETLVRMCYEKSVRGGASHKEALELAAARYSNDSRLCKYQINAEFKDYGLPVAYPLPLE